MWRWSVDSGIHSADGTGEPQLQVGCHRSGHKRKMKQTKELNVVSPVDCNWIVTGAVEANEPGGSWFISSSLTGTGERLPLRVGGAIVTNSRAGLGLVGPPDEPAGVPRRTHRTRSRTRHTVQSQPWPVHGVTQRLHCAATRQWKHPSDATGEADVRGG
jgi:hypothetical protein